MRGFIILFTAILLSGCSSKKKIIDYNSFSISQEQLSKISTKIIFTSGLDKNKDPINDLTEFEVKNDAKSICYISWFDLDANKDYYVKVKWFGPNNEIFEQDDDVFKPNSPSYYSWLKLNLVENVTPKGKFKVQVFLNNSLVKELYFTTK